LVNIINKNFDLRPGVIVKEFDLAKPICFQTAKNRHFTNQSFNWEKPKALKLLASSCWPLSRPEFFKQ
jgi:S-adenosylmethionine synthetase